ncbi:dihydroorotase [Desulfosporosinus sp. HMP52]|uniref:dihydroorotase n=1 Tax=Desulfosporosinus sp. HMP52 TaxID=1487923 RepID=UPI00051FA499|nr:dihydroorotase [Desulfosporosinus sp. HMP52]KGK91462.1 dihydroorotase [Desulfosporosinus sp. HMP52]
MYKLGIVNGHIVSGKEIKKANLYIQDGKIALETTEFLEAAEIYNAEGLHIIPGCLDVHCHFRDPGYTDKEDMLHGTRAAAVGGVTTVFDMPNTNPPVRDAQSFREKAVYFSDRAYVDFALWGLALGEMNSSKLAEMVEAGAIAFKFFWGYALNSKTYELIYNYKPEMPDLIAPLDNGEVYELFEEVARTGALLAIHAEDHVLVRMLTERVLKSGRRDYSALLEARSNLAEEVAIQTAIAFSKVTGARLHIAHISTQEGIELVKEAQKKGIPVTTETCSHHLFLDSGDYDRVGPVMKVYPPVRGKRDRQALWSGLQEGTVSLVCSDHAPHKLADKKGDLFSVPAGMCDVETMLPLMINEVSRGVITLPFVVQKMAENPAKLFDLYPQKGCLEIGADADLVLIDLNKETEIRNERLHSKQPITGFHGTFIKGCLVATFLRGRQIMKDGEVIGEPQGELVKPQRRS